MKNSAVTFAIVLMLSGCGNENDPNLASDLAYFGDFKDGLAICHEDFSNFLIQDRSNNNSTIMRFVSSNKDVIDIGSQVGEMRCNEVKNHLSGVQLKQGTKTIPNDFALEIEFFTTAQQDAQLLLGHPVQLRPENAHINFVDGSLNNSRADLTIRCPGTATATCQITEIGDYKKCESYNINYSDQCTFKGTILMFNFSDHKAVNLDVGGDLLLSSGSAQLKFDRISWIE